MRYLRLLLVVAVVGVAAFVPRGDTAFAAFHCMRIHAVMHNFDGHANVQYVELRMDTGGQTFIGGHTLEFYDAANVLKATFTFPSGVGSGDTADSVLVGTQEFNEETIGGDADFTFSFANTTGVDNFTRQHPVQGPGGKVHFARNNDNCDADGVAGAGEVDSVKYGSFVGTGGFGSNAAALPARAPGEKRALTLNAHVNTGSPTFQPINPSDNSAEYSLTAVSTVTTSVAVVDLNDDLRTPRNNGNTILKLELSPPVGGVAEEPDVPASTASADDSGGANETPYVAGAAGAILIIMLGSAAWYLRRRQA